MVRYTLIGGLDFGFGIQPLVLQGKWEATSEHQQTSDSAPNRQFE